jgi:hypothetical protein
MVRNVVIFVVIVLLVFAGVVWYRQHQQTALASGDTVSPDGSVAVGGSSTGSLAPESAPAPAPVKRTATQPAPAVQAPDTNMAAPPAADTIQRDPPNGMVFAGTGHFQVYRQGAITWRINTDTGKACVLFATDAEWRKARVYSQGCGRG